jgi:ankyrin repeat protein
LKNYSNMMRINFKRSIKKMKLLSIAGTCSTMLMLIIVSNTIGQSVSDNNAKFLKAVTEGNIKLVQKFLEDGIDVDTRNEGNRTALVIAAGRGNLEMTRLLIKSNADVNAIVSEGGALVWASYAGSVEVVELLLDKGANVKARGTVNRTSLHHAAMSGNNEVIKKLLEAGIDVNAKDNQGETPLSMATVNYRGNAETLLILIEHGADVNVKTSSRSTPFIDMLNFNETIPREKIKVLIDHGLDVNAKTTNGKTALMTMAENGDVEKAKLPLEYGADMDGIDEAFKNVLNNGYVIPMTYHGWWISESL